MVPTLETERLRLRALGPDDLSAYTAMCADREVMRHLGGRPWDEETSWRHLAMLIGHWSLRGYGSWGVEEKESGTFLGRVGFIHPAAWPDFELGWALAREGWGRGYATEAARAARDFAFENLGRRDLISLIAPANVASRRVAEKLGAQPEGMTEVKGVSVEVWRCRRDEGIEARS
jgi:RimJ/RimL family protein N-acetyltransferase